MDSKLSWVHDFGTGRDFFIGYETEMAIFSWVWMPEPHSINQSKPFVCLMEQGVVSKMKPYSLTYKVHRAKNRLYFLFLTPWWFRLYCIIYLPTGCFFLSVGSSRIIGLLVATTYCAQSWHRSSNSHCLYHDVIMTIMIVLPMPSDLLIWLVEKRFSYIHHHRLQLTHTTSESDLDPNPVLAEAKTWSR